MTDKAKALMSAIKMNAAGLSDAQNVEEENTWFDIIFSLHFQLLKEFEDSEKPVIVDTNTDALENAQL